MKAHVRPAMILFLLLTAVTGIAYPLLVTVVAQGVFPHRANGSVLKRDGKFIGSEFIGQYFGEQKYFWSRPSATSPVQYTAFNKEASSGSTGSNLGPTNP